MCWRIWVNRSLENWRFSCQSICIFPTCLRATSKRYQKSIRTCFYWLGIGVRLRWSLSCIWPVCSRRSISLWQIIKVGYRFVSVVFADGKRSKILRSYDTDTYTFIWFVLWKSTLRWSLPRIFKLSWFGLLEQRPFTLDTSAFKRKFDIQSAEW